MIGNLLIFDLASMPNTRETAKLSHSQCTGIVRQTGLSVSLSLCSPPCLGLAPCPNSPLSFSHRLFRSLACFPARISPPSLSPIPRLLARRLSHSKRRRLLLYFRGRVSKLLMELSLETPCRRPPSSFFPQTSALSTRSAATIVACPPFNPQPIATSAPLDTHARRIVLSLAHLPLPSLEQRCRMTRELSWP